MVGVDVIATPEALIYCLGALKFLTGNGTIAKQLVSKECIEKLSTLLTSINKLVSCIQLVVGVLVRPIFKNNMYFS